MIRNMQVRRAMSWFGDGDLMINVVVMRLDGSSRLVCRGIVAGWGLRIMCFQLY